MSLLRCLQILIVVSFVQVGWAWGATYWVSKQGSDGNPCFASSTQPDLAKQTRRTIMAGAACLSTGDTLMVMPGDYNEHLLNPLPSNATLRSADPNPANWFVLKPQNNVIPSSTGAIRIGSARSNITFRYFKIDLSSINSGNRPHSCINYGNVVVTVTLEDFECIGPARGMVSRTGAGMTTPGYGSSSAIIRRGVIKNFCNTADCSPGSPGAHGIYWQGANTLVEGLWIENVNAYCVNMRNTGISQSNNTFRYNVCKDTVSGLLAVNDDGTGTNNVIHNNVFWNSNRIEFRNSGQKFFNNTIYGTRLSCMRLRGSKHIVQNNILLNCGSSPAIANESTGSEISYNLTSGTASKIFANPGAGDFRLHVGSPAIDAGTTISLINRDLVGTSRPQGCCYDIGAYEYLVSGSAPASPTNVDISAK